MSSDELPLVTVVIPVYNGSDYLSAAVQSALLQTYPRVEVLVVNDGSTDGGLTRAVARGFWDRVRYVEKANGGVASALNLGIAMMRGDYFVWLSHDDELTPDAVAVLMRHLRRGSTHRVAAGMTTTIDEGGNETRPPVRELSDPMFLLGAIEFWRHWVYACSMLVHRTCLDEIGGVDEKRRFAQDVELTLQLLHRYGVLLLPDVVCRRRVHSASGYSRHRKAVEAENERMLKDHVEKDGLGFFFARIPKRLGPVARARAYRVLGDLYNTYPNGFSRYCYRMSLGAWPSPFNAAAVQRLLSPRRLLVIGIQVMAAVRKRWFRYRGAVGQGGPARAVKGAMFGAGRPEGSPASAEGKQ